MRLVTERGGCGRLRPNEVAEFEQLLSRQNASGCVGAACVQALRGRAMLWTKTARQPHKKFVGLCQRLKERCVIACVKNALGLV